MTTEFDGEKFITGREGGDYYSGFYVDWLEEKITALKQKLEGFEGISLVPVGYGVDEQRGWGEYIAIRKSDWDKIVSVNQVLATTK